MRYTPKRCTSSEEMGLFPVYRLDEADSLLKEGGVWDSAGALRACSYKT